VLTSNFNTIDNSMQQMKTNEETKENRVNMAADERPCLNQPPAAVQGIRMSRRDRIATRFFAAGKNPRKSNSSTAKKCTSQILGKRKYKKARLGIENQTQINSLREGEEQAWSEDDHEYRSITEKPFACKFPGCRKTFLNQIRLTAHQHLHFGT